MNDLEVLETKMEMYKQSHQKIVSCKAKAELALWEYCKALYDMHQSKLYQAAGYANFEEYAEKEFGIKKTIAYEYLAFAKKRSEDFTINNGKIGVTKLLLLNKLSEAEAEEFLKENNIMEISAKEVKRTVANYLDLKNNTPIEAAAITAIEIASEENITSLGSFMKNHRLNKGLSQRATAEKLGMSHTQLNQIEANIRLIPFDRIECYEKIINLFQLSEAEIKQLYNFVDFAYSKRGKVAPDVTNFINSNKKLNSIIRKLLSNNSNPATLEKILKKAEGMII